VLPQLPLEDHSKGASDIMSQTTPTTTAAPTRPLIRLEKCEHLLDRLLDHCEKHIPEDGMIPLERMPILAETLGQLAQTEAILSGMAAEAE
jgi:hypothetical protein